MNTMEEATMPPETVQEPVAASAQDAPVKPGDRRLDVLSVDDALRASNGSRAQAAITLGITTRKLAAFITRNSVLSSKWGKEPGRPVGTAEILARGVVLENKGPLLTEPSVQAAFEAEQNKLSLGLDSLQLGPDGNKIALGMQRFANRHFRESIELMGGGMTRGAIMAQVRMDRIAARLDFVQSKISQMDTLRGSGLPGSPWFDMERAQLVDEEDRLCNHYARLLDLTCKTAMVGNEMQKTRISAMQLRDKNQRSSKPGFNNVITIPSTANPAATNGVGDAAV